MSELFLKLRNDHDLDEYKYIYEKNGLVRIERLLPDKLAEQIHDILVNQTVWHIVHATQNKTHKYYRPDAWEALSAKEQGQIINDVKRQARNGFSYLYACYPMIQSYIKGLNPQWPLHAMTEFLNTDEVLEFVKTITGEKTCNKLDCQATLYGPGHFLNTHYDADTQKLANRKAAYVMGFTKAWPANWGGQLLMLSDDDTVETGFTPTFNSLILFKVPRRHLVTQVANFAGHGRYSITGWLLEKLS